MTITNSTISGNIADDYGGGISCSGSEPIVITNSTISGNTASMGGGIRNDAPLTLNQVTLYGNRASEGSNILISHITTEITNSVIAGGIESENWPVTVPKLLLTEATI